MKKLLSLVLALTVISSCLALAGCNLFGEIFGTTGTEKRITPSERDPILDELELDYSEDFTEFDVEFIKTMRYQYFAGLPGYDYQPNFADAMGFLSVNDNTCYKIKVDIQNVLYFIAVYENPGKGGYFLEAGGIIEWAKWRKFSSYEEISSEIDGWNLIGSYAVHNCVVEKDILNEVVYNQSCKYYVPLTYGYSEDSYITKYDLREDAAWMDMAKLFGRSTPLTVLHTAKYEYCYNTYDLRWICGRDIYGYYVDENGFEYLSVENSKTIQEIVDEYWRK